MGFPDYASIRQPIAIIVQNPSCAPQTTGFFIGNGRQAHPGRQIITKVIEQTIGDDGGCETPLHIGNTTTVNLAIFYPPFKRGNLPKIGIVRWKDIKMPIEHEV